MESELKVTFSPQPGKKNFNEFFGLYGTLPLAFTERFLFLDQAPVLMRFFNLLSQNIKRPVQFNYPLCLLLEREQKRKYLHTCTIGEDYNRLNHSILSSFILGKEVLYWKETTLKSYGLLGSIKL